MRKSHFSLFWSFLSHVTCRYGLFDNASILRAAEPLSVEDGSISEAILITVGLVFSAPILLLGSCLAYLQLTERFRNLEMEAENEEAEQIDDWQQANG